METGLQADIRKTQLLREAGYRYNPERELYVNRNAKIAFSMDFIEKSDEQEIRRRISEAPPSHGWQFHFLNGPSPAVRKVLERMLANGHANR
jgi:hypothetical protein